MSDTERFQFVSEGLPNQKLHVVSFTGEEGLGRIFSLKINLVCDNPALDLSALLSHKAVFSISHDRSPKRDERRGAGGASPFDGYPASATEHDRGPEMDGRRDARGASPFDGYPTSATEHGQNFMGDGRRGGEKASSFYGYPVSATQKGSYKGYTYYEVDLRPDVWLLTQAVESTIFLNQGLADIAFSMLNAHQMRAVPYENRLMRHHPEQEFAMQYGESMYDYLVWRLEQEGAYFYFDPADGKLILADSPQSHNASKETFLYAPVSGLTPSDIDETVVSFSLLQSFLPKQVVVRSYDWRNPNQVVVGKADVSPSGIGDVYLTDEFVESNTEAGRIASIRAEEIVCHSRVFHGSGTISSLRPGLVFDLKGHYADSFQQSYIVTEIVHEGSQESFLSLGLGIPLRDSKNHHFYRNTFSCIEAGVPFRPRRGAKRAKVSGSIRAFIDGSQGAKPETDKYGRYKLLFPFDVSGRKGGNASCWIRMARPHIGKQSSLNLPICPGTEVLVSFIDGNPDRPVITGALANGENPLGVSSNLSAITTNGGNVIALNDTGNKQGIAVLAAAGVGRVTSSGSISTTVDSQDRTLTSASLSAATYASGYIASTACIKNTLTATKDVKTYIYGLLPMIGDTIKKIYTSVDQHTEAGDEAVAWISSMLPVVKSLCTCITGLTKGDKNKIGYGVTVSHNDTASTVNLFSDMTTTEIAERVIPPFLLRTGVRAVDVAMDVTQGDTRYEDKSKQPTDSDIARATIADLLPEILSLITIFATIKKKNHFGDIGILAQKSNVNITAKTVASMHAAKNIIFSTFDCVDDKAFGKMTEMGTQNDDSTLKIGNNKEISPVLGNETKFIKINTEVMHTDNTCSVFKNKKSFHSEATEHNFFSFSQDEVPQDNNVAQLSLVYTPNTNNPANSESKINLYANNLFLEEGHESASEYKDFSSSIRLNQGILLSFQNDNKKISDEITLDSDNLKMETKNNGEIINSIVMNVDKESPTIEIKCKDTSIVIDGKETGKITINSVKEVNFGDAIVTAKNIKGPQNLTIEAQKIDLK